MNKEAMLPHGCYFMVMNSGTNKWFLVIAICVYVGGGSQDVVEILRVGLLLVAIWGGGGGALLKEQQWCCLADLSSNTLYLIIPRLCFFIVLICDLIINRDDSLTS